MSTNTSEQIEPSGATGKAARAFVVIGLAAFVEMLFTIEWSYPYCLSRADGPAYAVHGMPFPYEIYSGVSSLEYFVMPHVHAVNMAILSATIWVLSRIVFRRARTSKSWLVLILWTVGIWISAPAIAFTLVTYAIGAARPTWSIGTPNYLDYSSLRPVGFIVGRARECTSAPQWFSEGRHSSEAAQPSVAADGLASAASPLRQARS